MTPLPVDHGADAVSLEHEIDGPRVPLNERDTRDALRRITSQPIDSLGDQWIGVTGQKSRKLRELRLHVAKRTFFGSGGPVVDDVVQRDGDVRRLIALVVELQAERYANVDRTALGLPAAPSMSRSPPVSFMSSRQPAIDARLGKNIQVARLRAPV